MFYFPITTALDEKEGSAGAPTLVKPDIEGEELLGIAKPS
jgi:hypothetical protein